MPQVGYTTPSRPQSGLLLALGGWLFASPWMFGYGSMGPAAINSVLVGVLIFITGSSAAVSLMGPALVSVSVMSGLWTVASPWIFGYAAAEVAMWNDILVGIAVAGRAVFGAIAGMSRPAGCESPSAR